ncbi:hypothetical protein BCR44DRAFT_44611 [Catenaria anguillulae PL171]|uniref:Uncharacterized protein n=1 Tax=Catenaria anguillulae PL171 TaxID=765915 RepID=A0A1Y2H7S6_9FUNG|nr:hypothetical protein BCR44DRAFT_44611 [Catenaria anguillulae PL171]
MSPTNRRLFLALAALLAVTQVVNALYIDYCGANEFERVYRRSPYMTMDYRNPDVHQDITRYKRDFAGASKWEQDTFIVWRFPNGETNNKVFLVVNEMRPDLSIPGQNNLVYSWSMDDKTWNTLPASAMTSTTERLNDAYTRRNVAITLPQAARFFQVYWPPCQWDPVRKQANCINYYAPSINHLCAANTARGEDANLRTCFPNGRYDPPAVSPTKKYCGAQMINDFWDFRLFGTATNLLGAYSAADGSMARAGHHVPKEGLGQGSVYMTPNDASYWVEVLAPGPQCFDASRFTHLHFDITARAGFTVDIALETGVPGTCNQRVGLNSGTANSARYTTWTSPDLVKKKVVIPLADLQPNVNLRNARTILLRNFRNPSRGWVYMDNIALIGGEFRSPIGATPARLTANAGAGAVSANMNCVSRSAFEQPAVKFTAQSNVAGASFSVRLITDQSEQCSSGNRQVATVNSRDFYSFPLDDLPIPFDFVVPVTSGNARIASIEVVNVQPAGASVTLSNLRVGNAGCVEPENRWAPNWEPVPYPAGFTPKIVDVFPQP